MSIHTTGSRKGWRAAAAAALAVAMGTGTLTAQAEPVPAAECTVTASVAEAKPFGTAANMWGTTSAGCGAGTLIAEKEVNGQWINVGSTVVDADGGFYVAPLQGLTADAGTHRVRARIANTTSEAVTMVRHGEPTASTAPFSFVGWTASVWGQFPGAARAEVRTEVRLADGRWVTSQRGRTKDNGTYTLPLTYAAGSAGTQTYRVAAVYPDGTTIRTEAFGFIRRVLPTISTAGSAPTGRTANAWGQFSGGGNIPVWTEVRLSDGRWVTSQTGRTKDNGTYILPLTYGANKAGKYTFRVAGRYPDGRVVRSQSASLTRTNPQVNLDRRCLTGRVMCASKSDRKLRWVVNGEVKLTLDARFGSVRHPTREGTFNVGWKSRYHVSSIYGTSMPWAMFFSGGQAVHYSENFRIYGWNHPGSAGCINIRDAARLDWLYKQVRVGDKVVVYR